MESTSLQDYRNLLERRKLAFFTVAAIVFGITCVFAFLWPPLYRSLSVIEIAQPDVTQDVTTPLGQPAAQQQVADLATNEVAHVQERVLETGNLVDIIAKLGLYPIERQTSPMSQLVDKMRRHIEVTMISANSLAAGTATGAPGANGTPSAIAFSLGFTYSDPATAQLAANELMTRFLDEDMKEQQTKATITSGFLDAQIKSMDVDLSKQEEIIGDFTTKHAGGMPTDLAFNMQTEATLATTVEAIIQQIAALDAQRGNLMSTLATTYPYSQQFTPPAPDGTVAPTLTSPRMQLKSLEAQFAAMSGKYGANYPDMVAITRQIAALKSFEGAGPNSGPINAQIAQLKATAAREENLYGATYPDVVQIRRQIEVLEQQSSSMAPGSSTNALDVTDADNPAYLLVKAQLSSVEEQYKALIAQRDSATQQEALYQKRIAETPEVDRVYSALSRDYDNEQLRYREMKEKKLSADLEQQVAQGQSGEHFEVVDSPLLPDSPSFPNRPIVISLGLLLSVFSGFAGAMVAELLSTTVNGVAHISKLAGSPPLVVIPEMLSEEETAQRRRRIFMATIAAGVAVLIGIALFLTFVMPLDVLWAVVTRSL